MKLNIEPAFSTVSKYEAFFNDGDIKPCSKATLIVSYRADDRPVGIIEDVWTHEDYRKRGLATSLIKRLLELSKEHNCYKVILDCADHNVSFYKKIGFKIWQNSMRIDI